MAEFQGGRMTRCAVFIATSLDGYIARADGSIDWLEEANTRIPSGEDCGYAQFRSGIDAIVMGRNTFELALGFGAWVYQSTPVVVLSSRLTTLPPNLPSSVSISADKPQDLVRRLSAKGLDRLYIDGGLTIQSFLAVDLIDEMTITTIPVILGGGIPLFGTLDHDLPLTLIESKAYDFGFVQSKYRVDHGK
jgi:dihydrofolate reductase